MITEKDRDQVKENPSLFIEKTIKDYVASNSNSCLPDSDNEPLFDEPLIGYADGDDEIFYEFKKDILIGDFHLTPQEALTLYMKRQGKKISDTLPEHLSVISAIFPFTKNIKKSNRDESQIGSLIWNKAHNWGFPFMEECMQYLANQLEDLGYIAVVPSYTKPMVEIMSKHGITSDWSEKHIAYAAGLGTFSLSGGLITPKGKAVGCCSLITDLVIPATPKPYKTHTAYCPFYLDGSCGQCIKRCPSGAISENGYDAFRCFEYNTKILKKIIKETCREGYPDEHIICGLCESMVPCENRIPAKIKI